MRGEIVPPSKLIVTIFVPPKGGFLIRGGFLLGGGDYIIGILLYSAILHSINTYVRTHVHTYIHTYIHFTSLHFTSTLVGADEWAAEREEREREKGECSRRGKSNRQTYIHAYIKHALAS